MITFWLTARGFARSFTIAPLNVISLGTLPEEQMRMGSGLLSLNRGIASASSVALAATVFQNRLAERMILLAQDQSLAPTDADGFLQELTRLFIQLGDFGQLAQTKALSTMQRLLTAEAALHSYHDTFMIIGCISAAGILPALWMNQRRRPSPDRPGRTDRAAPAGGRTPSPASLPEAKASGALSRRHLHAGAPVATRRHRDLAIKDR
jgi:hypothetical protein